MRAGREARAGGLSQPNVVESAEGGSSNARKNEARSIDAPKPTLRYVSVRFIPDHSASAPASSPSWRFSLVPAGSAETGSKWSARPRPGWNYPGSVSDPWQF